MVAELGCWQLVMLHTKFANSSGEVASSIRHNKFITIPCEYFLFREAFKKNCDYSDIVPISFYTHPPEGDRDSNYREKIKSSHGRNEGRYRTEFGFHYLK